MKLEARLIFTVLLLGIVVILAVDAHSRGHHKSCERKPSVCRPHGKCVRLGVKHFKCKCRAPYAGHHCKNKSDSQAFTKPSVTRESTSEIHNVTRFIHNTPKPTKARPANPCDTTPPICGRHGTCVPVRVAIIKCICKPTFHGKFCTHRKDTSVMNQIRMNKGTPCERKGYQCSPHGKCVNHGRKRYHCVCLVGFTGDFCKHPVPKITTVKPTASAKRMLMAVRRPPDHNKKHKAKHYKTCKDLQCKHGNCVADPGSMIFYCKCTPGWEGTACTDAMSTTTMSNAMQPCDKDHCVNGMCIYTLDGYVCDCSPNWTGDTCEQKVHLDVSAEMAPMRPCDDQPCRNEGECINVPNTKKGYRCECQGRWSGAECEIPHFRMVTASFRPCDESPCAHGTCTNVPEVPDGYHCTCEEGYAGDECDQSFSNLAFAHGNDKDKYEQSSCDDLVPCEHGRCVGRGNGYKCQCSFGWVGSACATEDVCLNSPCENNGTCSMENEELSCDCAPGYGGDKCEHAFNACQSGPCLNGGACEDTGPDQFKCICAEGYSQPRCQAHPCSNNPCKHGGMCEVAGPNDFSCKCAAGFSSPMCQTQDDPCDSNPCAHGSTCHPDLNDGNEPATFSCKCRPGYGGKNCSKMNDACEKNPCAHGGKCISAEDMNNLERMEQIDKVQIAMEMEYSCMCPPLFTGSHCEAELKGCTSSPCKNKGKCIELSLREKQEGAKRSYMCDCPNGFSGPNCEMQGTCDDKPCLHGGTCEDTPDGFICLCKPSWTGNTCESKLNTCKDNPCPANTICAEDESDQGFSCTPSEGKFDQDEVYRVGVPITPPASVELTKKVNDALFIFGVIAGVVSVLTLGASGVLLCQRYREEIGVKKKKRSVVREYQSRFVSGDESSALDEAPPVMFKKPGSKPVSETSVLLDESVPSRSSSAGRYTKKVVSDAATLPDASENQSSRPTQKPKKTSSAALRHSRKNRQSYKSILPNVNESTDDEF